MTLELKKFDMKTISFKPNENKGPVIVLIGRRDTGKSYLVKDILYESTYSPGGPPDCPASPNPYKLKK